MFLVWLEFFLPVSPFCHDRPPCNSCKTDSHSRPSAPCGSYCSRSPPTHIFPRMASPPSLFFHLSYGNLESFRFPGVLQPIPQLQRVFSFRDTLLQRKISQKQENPSPVMKKSRAWRRGVKRASRDSFCSPALPVRAWDVTVSTGLCRRSPIHLLTRRRHTRRRGCTETPREDALQKPRVHLQCHLQ